MKMEPVKVLLIEDDLGYARLIKEMIKDAKEESFTVEHRTDLNKGLKRLSRGGVDVILLDLLLPDSEGLSTFLSVRNRENKVPIVVLTSIEDEKTATTAVRRGAQDYLFKREITPGLLVRALSYAVLRNEADEKLRESKMKLRAQYMGIPIPTYTWQKTKNGFVLVNYNDTALATTEGRISNYLGKIANEIFVDEKEILRNLYSCYKKESTVKCEIVDRNDFFSRGRHLVVSYTYVPPDLVLIHTEDIAEHSQDKKELHRTTNYFESTLRASTDGVVITDFSQNIIMVNEAFCNFFGKKRQEVNETNLFDWLEKFEGDAKKCWAELEKRVCKEGVSRDVEFAKFLGDKKIHLSVNASVIKEVFDGEAQVVVSIWRDITEKKLAEEELQKAKGELKMRVEERTSELKEANKKLHLEVTNYKREKEMLNETEEMYRLVTDTMEDTAWMMDMNFVTIYTNPSTTHLRGYTSEELKKMPLEVNLTPESLKIAKKRISEEMTPERLAQKDLNISATLDLEFYRKDGSTRWYEIRTSIIRDDDGNPCKILGVSRDISKRKKAEEALLESELKYRNLFENSISPVFTVDLEGNFTSANKALEEIWGYKLSEVVGTNYRKFVKPEAANEIFKAYNHLFCAGEPIRNMVYNLIRKDGEEITVECYVDVIRKGEKIVGFQGTLRDITEQKQAEVALKESEEKLNTLLNATTEVVGLGALDGTILAVNNALAKSLGRKKDELLGKNVYEILPEEVAESRMARVQSVVDSKEPSQWEDENEGKYFNNSIYPIFDDNGNVKQVAVFAEDITGRKQMEERLHFLALAIEQSDEGIALTDIGGELLFVNRALGSMYGYSPDELVGRNLSEMHNAEQMPVFEAAYQQIKKSGGFSGEIFSSRRDGAVFPIMVHSSIIKDVDGKPLGILSTVQDVTERKRTEEALQKVEEKYRLLVENANEVILVGQEGKVVFANRKAFEELGYSEEELFSINIFEELIHPDDRPMLLENHFKRLRGEDIPNVYPFRVVDKEGETRWVEINSVFIAWEGKPATLNFLKEITDRKKMEEAIRESEEKYRLLVDASFDGIVVLQDGAIKFLNKRGIERYIEYSDSESSTVSFIDLVHPDDREKIIEQYKMKMMGEKALDTVIFRLVEKDGKINWAEANGVPITWEGKPAIQVFLRDITEKVIAEEALRFQSTITEQVTNSIIVTDTDFKIIYVNQAAKDMYGYSEEEFLGKSPNFTCADPDVNSISEEIYSTVSAGKAWIGSSKDCRKDGTTFDSELKISPMFNNVGDIVAYVGVLNDITFRKRWEEKIINIAQEWRATFDSFSDKISIRDKNYRYIKVNKAFADTFNMHPRDIIGRLSYELEEGLDKPRPDCPYMKAYKTKKVVVREKFIPETEVYSEATISPVIGDGGEVIAIVDFTKDITERKHADEALARAAEEWQETFDAVDDLIAIIDDERKVLRTNRAMMEAFSGQDVVGKKCYELFHGTNQPLPDCPCTKTLKSGMPEHYEFKEPHMGNRIFDVFTYPIKDEGGGKRKVVHKIRDITEKKLVEQSIRQALSEKEILLREVHHRVKNNLQVISSLLDMDGMNMSERDGHGFLNDARSRIHTMALIHSQLYQSERFDKINLAKHARELIEFISVVHSSKETAIDSVIEDFDVTLPVTQAIPLSLVLNELITNIYKHAFKEGQKGTLECSMQKSSQGIVSLVIKDNGVGLPEGFNIDEVKSLGLKLVRNLVREQLKGDIAVSFDGGTKFLINFKSLKEEGEYVKDTGS